MAAATEGAGIGWMVAGLVVGIGNAVLIGAPAANTLQSVWNDLGYTGTPFGG